MLNTQKGQNTSFEDTNVKKERPSFSLLFTIVGFAIFFGPIIACMFYIISSMPPYFHWMMKIAVIGIIAVSAIFMIPVIIGSFTDKIVSKVDELQNEKAKEYVNIYPAKPIDFNDEKIIKQIKKGKLNPPTEPSKILTTTQDVLKLTSKAIVLLWIVKLISYVFHEDVKVGKK